MRRVGYWLAVLVAAGVTVAGCLVAYAGYRQETDPGAVVRSYFAALARGDAASALALGSPPARSHAYLTSAVLHAQLQVAAISDIRIGAVTGTGDSRTVAYSTELTFASGARTIPGQADVRRDGRSWQLERTAVSVQLAPRGATSRFTLAGTGLPDEHVVLFPGAVPVVPDTPHLRPRSSGVVAFGADRVVDIGVEVSATGRRDVLAALRPMLRDCFAPNRPSRPQCPLPPDPRIVPTSVRGSLHTADIDHLTFSVSPNASGAILIGGSVRITGSYQHLNRNNIAHTVRGTFRVSVRATTPAVGKPRVRFEDASG